MRLDAAGFRLRGLQTTRLETFTDAAFAFALTLLVITLDPPTRLSDLISALHNVPAFLMSATMLMMFWWGHHEWSRRYGLDDAISGTLSCLLVFTVLLYVYPLRFVFTLMTAWIARVTGLAISPAVSIDGPQDVNTVFAIYGVGFTVMAGAIALLNVHAWRRREMLELDAVERHETRGAIGAWLILTVTGIVSTVIALVVPARLAGMPGWAYAPLGFLMPLWGHVVRSRRPQVTAPPELADASPA